MASYYCTLPVTSKYVERFPPNVTAAEIPSRCWNIELISEEAAPQSPTTFSDNERNARTWSHIVPSLIQIVTLDVLVVSCISTLALVISPPDERQDPESWK